MSATLIQRVNELNIEYTDKPISISIRYGGSFIGQVLGNTRSRITRTKIDIHFLDDVPETIMRYEGNLIIYGITVISKNLESAKGGKLKLINDEVQRIQAQWDVSTQKWEDYDKSNSYYKPVMSLIEYKENDNIKYHEVRDRLLLSLPSRQSKILNRIRGDYGSK